MKENKSFVISVKLRPGCYKHLKVSLGCSLEDFASSILDAFDFFNNHLHAFFMDNKVWSNEESYYMYYDGSHEDRYTDEYKVDVLNVGQKFIFLYDFGSEWTFKCKVLKEVTDDKENCDIEVIKSVGSNPRHEDSFWI